MCVCEKLDNYIVSVLNIFWRNFCEFLEFSQEAGRELRKTQRDRETAKIVFIVFAGILLIFSYFGGG